MNIRASTFFMILLFCSLCHAQHVGNSGPDVNPRMVTWVRLSMINPTLPGESSPYPQDYRGHWENNQEFYVFNTHFFNGDQQLARLNGAKLLRDRLERLQPFGHWSPKRPVVVMGDFNCLQGSDPHRVLVGDESQPGILNETITQGQDIDWILYNGNVEVLKYEEVDFNQSGVYPSDHKPIYVELRLFNQQ